MLLQSGIVGLQTVIGTESNNSSDDCNANQQTVIKTTHRPTCTIAYWVIQMPLEMTINHYTNIHNPMLLLIGITDYKLF